MTAPKLRIVPTRAHTIEDALAALVPVMADPTLTSAARAAAVALQRELHACRSQEMVARMEREQGIAPGGNAA